jgi:hypothetical protein
MQAWERDAPPLAVADEEGLDSGEESMLARVRQAKRRLEN